MTAPAPYRKRELRRYGHPYGSWIGRVAGGRCPWKLPAPSGGLVSHCLLTECCLRSETQEAPADVWHLIGGHPNTYSLVQPDVAEEPTEVTGTQLVCLNEQGRIRGVPASLMPRVRT